MRYAVFSCSLNPTSRSRRLAEFARMFLAEIGAEVDYFDLREHPLPDFSDDASCQTPVVDEIVRRLAQCQGIILAVPIYNWSPGSMLKKLMECTGNLSTGGKVWAWENKVVTFLCAGGLHHSYMAYGSTAISLMMDFKCIINPHIVYAREVEVSNEGELSPEIQARLEKVLRIGDELTVALSGRKLLTGWSV